MSAYRTAMSCRRPDEESALQDYPHGLPVRPSPYTRRNIRPLLTRLFMVMRLVYDSSPGPQKHAASSGMLHSPGGLAEHARSRSS